MKDWSLNAESVMRFLGNFGPTVNAGDRQVKGYMLDEDGDAGKVYLNPNDLRDIAAACLEVAAWLNERSDEA